MATHVSDGPLIRGGEWIERQCTYTIIFREWEGLFVVHAVDGKGRGSEDEVIPHVFRAVTSCLSWGRRRAFFIEGRLDVIFNVFGEGSDFFGGHWVVFGYFAAGFGG